MSRLFLLSALLYAPAALACPGEKSGTAHASTEASTEAKSGSGCHMPAATTVAELPKDGTRAKLTVAGMHCGACADKVHTALLGVEGVKGAKVDAATGVAEVAYDAKKTNLDKMVAAVALTGKFTATVATN